jgi:hypothetical protein
LTIPLMPALPAPSRQLPVAMAVALLLAPPAFAQAAPAQAPAASAASAPVKEQVRVPNSGANVHMGSSSGSELLVVLPKGTVLDVLGRDKEWIQVRLTPELRKTGLVFRWYKNEDRGWMHDSTVEVLANR